jgi:hypothetical protein
MRHIWKLVDIDVRESLQSRGIPVGAAANPRSKGRVASLQVAVDLKCAPRRPQAARESGSRNIGVFASSVWRFFFDTALDEQHIMSRIGESPRSEATSHPSSYYGDIPYSVLILGT